MKYYRIINIMYIMLLAAPPAIGQNTDGKIAFYSLRSGRDDIYMMNADGSNVQLLTNGRYGGKCPDLSPDGKRIVFVTLRDGNSEIYTLDLISGEEHRLTDLPSVERQPKWSPDGSKIALQSDRDGNYEIYVMDADGSNWQRLTYNEAEELWPKWSPDGRQIAFNSFRDGNWEIYIINSDGSGLRRLTDSDLYETNVSWSPDGTRLAFRSGLPRQFQGNIHVINIDGTNEIELTDIDGVEENPVWSPDGAKIAFQTMKDGNFEIYIMNTDGSDWQNLTNHAAHDYWASWVSSATAESEGRRNLLPDDVELHILYDNYPSDKRLVEDWGFSCLVKAGANNILMDTGGDGELLLSNIAACGVNLESIDAVMISHCHSDHIDGLPSIVGSPGNPEKVYVPCKGLPQNLIGQLTDLIEVELPTVIFPGASSTGPLGDLAPEQSLIIETDSGAVVVTGCCHPGVDRVVQRVIEMTGKPVFLLIGGFHLSSQPAQMIDNLAAGLDNQVKYIAPCHCSGDLARERFKLKFGVRYIEVGVGSVVKIAELAE